MASLRSWSSFSSLSSSALLVGRFCCRGCGEAEGEVLGDEVISMMSFVVALLGDAMLYVLYESVIWECCWNWYGAAVEGESVR